MIEDTATELAHDAEFTRVYDLYSLSSLCMIFKRDALTVVKARYLAEKESAHKFGLLSDDESQDDTLGWSFGYQ